MVPTIDELEEYFDYVERLVLGTLTAASPDLPNIQDTLKRLWLDISRFGPPGLPSLPPGLGTFEVPPPPPPPPTPKSLLDHAGDYIVQHPWMTSGMVISALGAGLLVGYSVVRTRSLKGRRAKVMVLQSERRQAVVILGGDHPLGLPLILEFEKQGYIVITSVSSPEAVSDLESKGHGYIRAIILDPSEPGTIPVFLRSLASTLSRRFPITAAGDPYAPTPYHPVVHSVISLLTMPTTSHHCAPAPFEQISLRGTYLPHLLSTHVAPLQAIQALLPLLRTDASRTRGHKSIILCLPAADARVGLPFGSVNAMTAAANLRAADVLRREIAVAQGMNAIRIVAVDVGAVGSSTRGLGDVGVNMDDWTPSEKATYGTAFSTLQETRGLRVPVNVSTFVDCLVGVVSGGTKARYSGNFVFGLSFGLLYEKVKDWIRGDRFSIGAGAGTYAIASYLPPVVLDSLLALPHLLINIRNHLSPPPPRSQPPSNRASVSVTLTSRLETVAATGTTPLIRQRSIEQTPAVSIAPVNPESHSDIDNQEMASDTDAESNYGDLESTGVGRSWVSLGLQEPSAE